MNIIDLSLYLAQEGFMAVAPYTWEKEKYAVISYHPVSQIITVVTNNTTFRCPIFNCKYIINALTRGSRCLSCDIEGVAYYIDLEGK